MIELHDCRVCEYPALGLEKEFDGIVFYKVICTNPKCPYHAETVSFDTPEDAASFWDSQNKQTKLL